MTGSNVAKKYENERAKTQRDVQVVNVKRNPYLADYQQHRNDSMKIVSIEREPKRRNQREGKIARISHLCEIIAVLKRRYIEMRHREIRLKEIKHKEISYRESVSCL